MLLLTMTILWSLFYLFYSDLMYTFVYEVLLDVEDGIFVSYTAIGNSHLVMNSYIIGYYKRKWFGAKRSRHFKIYNGGVIIYC